MKRLISIFFLTLFLLYHVGYLAFYWLSLRQIEHRWQNLVEYEGLKREISVPFTLPYWTDQSEYTKASGKVQLDGKLYRKIQQKYTQDAIHIILVEDTLTKELKRSVSDWISTMTDTQPNGSGKYLFKSVAKDYVEQLLGYCLEPAYELLTKKYFSYDDGLQNFFLEVTTPPPQV